MASEATRPNPAERVHQAETNFSAPRFAASSTFVLLRNFGTGFLNISIYYTISALKIKLFLLCCVLTNNMCARFDNFCNNIRYRENCFFSTIQRKLFLFDETFPLRSGPLDCTLLL
jgi:hypothetical protein